MKRLFSILAIVGVMAFGTVNANTNANTHTIVNTIVSQTDDDVPPAEEAGFHQGLKKRFIEGGCWILWALYYYV